MKTVFTFHSGSNQMVGLVNKLLLAGIPFKVGPVSPVTEGVAINAKYNADVITTMIYCEYGPVINGTKTYYSID